jgi:uncharacterized protein YacL
MNLSSVSKAVAGALVTMIVAYLVKHGITLEPVVTSALGTLIDALVTALAGYLAVYFAPKNK